MELQEIVNKLELQVLSGEKNLGKDVSKGYLSDILSDAMANAVKGSLWITNQTHENVIAIVFFKSLAGVILPDNLEPEQTALQKAKEKNIPVFRSGRSAFDIAGQLYDLGIRGR
ncbi:MAG TPA: DRTGG domain-containing protein [bacterium]|nr:DRTGG domain-containing protein [bacterium]HPN43377.1 DRTGG domain-containing protein [bacterium]